VSTAFALWVEGLEHEISVASFSGREALSKPFAFDVTFATSGGLAAEAVLGRRARLTIETAGKTRLVAGIVDRFERGRPLARGARFAVRLVPALTRLGRRRRSAIYQDVTTLEVARRLFDEHGIAFRFACANELPKRVFCVQHEESDLALLERLFAEEGLVYRVEAPEKPEGAETVVVFDVPARYGELPGGRVLTYRRDQERGALRREEHFVSHFVSRRRDGSRAILLDDYDFKFPSRFAASSAPVAAPPPAHVRSKAGLPPDGVFEHHGPYGEMQAVVQRADVALEQLTRDLDRYAAKSACARLAPGQAFELEEHEDAGLSGEYAVTSVVHRGRIDDATPLYGNRFRCVRRGVLFRPPRPERRVRQSLESATVVGPPGEEIHTDELGRIKVEFHWDLEGRGDDRSSCWIRLAQAWAGAGWGFQFVPRIGMEVLVAFLGGDPDRPMVVGCVSNATHLPPYPPAKNKTRSGVKTRSTPESEGYNEISFEDAAGGEELRLHAQRDMNTRVLRAQTVAVGASRDVAVGGNLSEVVGGLKTEAVAGLATTALEGGGLLRVRGSYGEDVDGDMTTTVSDDRTVTVRGTDKLVVEGDREERVVGPWTQRAEGVFTLQVGTDEVRGHADVQIRGTGVIGADDTLRFEALDGLTLRCGESAIELTPDGIVLRGPTIAIKGSRSVVAEGPGPAVRLFDEAELVADKVSIYAKDSSLELNSDASLRGKMLYLNCKAQKPPSESEQAEPKTKKFAVKLTDERYEPYASKRYQLLAEGERFEGTTGADGALEHEVPETAKVAHLTLWPGEYPTGDKKEFSFVLRETPAIDTMAGVKLRLKNLGYFHGPVESEALDEAAMTALSDFQKDHELPSTGRVDDATKAALLERYGH
jgi:type VI secretion system secreted protein VgrG